MDGFHEKKWFVYVGDHHEGPFSLEDLQGKVSEGAVGSASFAWCEGMADWKSVVEISEFETILKPGASPILAAVPVPEKTKTVTVETPAASAPVKDMPPLEIDRTGEVPIEKGPLVSKKTAALILMLVLIGGGATAHMQGKFDPILNSPGVSAAFRTVKDAAQPLVFKLVDQFPAVGKFLSPIPNLADVSAEDLEDLKSAAQGRPEAIGPKLSIALSQADLLKPEFYVATNLPDGLEVNFYIEGVPDSLLNQLSASAQSSGVVKARLGKSGVIQGEGGKPLPRGEYTVVAVESENQPEPVKALLAGMQPTTAKLPLSAPKSGKLVARKTYFLSGKKDTTYESRLKEFHEKLRTKAKAELDEAKAFLSALETHLALTSNTFAKTRKVRSAILQGRTWRGFHDTWRKFDGDLNAKFAKWTPESLNTDFFYGPVYAEMQRAGTSIQRVHVTHHSYFSGKVDARSFDIKLGEAVSQAESAINQLRAKIKQVEDTPPSSGGLPQKISPTAKEGS